MNACAGHTDSVSSLAFSSDGQLLASGSFDGLVKIWDMSGNLKRTLEGPGGGIEVKLHNTWMLSTIIIIICFH